MACATFPFQPVERAAAVVQGDGMVFYGEGAVTTPRYNVYDANAFGTEATGATAAATIRHTVIKAAPTGSGRNEFIAGVQTTGGVLYIQRWNGTAWSAEFNVTVGDGNLPRFDIAYEQTSGRAVVVYGTNATTNELAYRTYNGTSWAAAVTLASANTAGVVDGVKLEPRNGTNEIGLAYADNLWDLSGNFWNAALNSGAGGWVGEPTGALSTNLSRTGAPAACTGSTSCMTNWSFDIAFESTSGEFLVGWGTEAVSDPTFRQRTAGVGGAWAAANVAGTAAADEATDIELKADPNSNYVGYANVTGESTATAASPDLETGMWTGTAYANNNAGDTATGLVEAGTNNVTTGWVRSGAEDVFVVVYDDAAVGVNFRYWTKSSALWAGLPDFTGATAPAAAQKVLRMRNDPYDASELMLVVVDANSDVFTKKMVYTGGANLTWSSVGPSAGTAAHEVGGSSITGMSADFVYNKYIPPAAVTTLEQSAYRWFNANISGTSINSNTIDTSTTNSTTSSSSQRRTFYDSVNSRYWAFYHNGSNIEYSYSADGSSWTSAGTLGGATNDLSTWYVEGTSTVYLAYRDSGIKVQKGTLSGSSITWGATTTYSAATDLHSVSISRDTNGKLWLTYIDPDGSITNGAVLAVRSINADNITAWNTATIIGNGSGGGLTYGAILAPMSGGDMYFIYSKDDSGTVSLSGKMWDESANAFLTEQFIAGGDIFRTYSHSMVVTSNDDVHLGYAINSVYYYKKRTAGAWTADVSIGGSPTSDNKATVTKVSDNELRIFYQQVGTTQIATKRGVAPYALANWDSTATTFDASTSNALLSSAYVSTSTISPLIWTANSASPFDVKFYGQPPGVNAYDVSTPLAALNTVATAPAQGIPFRLRANLHVAGANVALSGKTLKLQYAGKGTGTCAAPAGGTPSTYTDVTSATLIKYYDDPNVTDGTALTVNANDPTHSADVVKPQTVEEANNFTNSVSAINIGEDGKWDFSLVNGTSAGGLTYCFRIVDSTGAVLDTYSQYPELTTLLASPVADIVDAANAPVTSPSVAMAALPYGLDCQTSTGTLGSSGQKIRTSDNGSSNWSLTMAATSGGTTQWSAGTPKYDYNDPSGSPAGCIDGGDVDTYGGQLSVNPSVGTLSSSCSTTGVTKGGSTAFNEGVVTSTTLSSASGAATGCNWDLIGVALSQAVPKEQTAGSYTVNMTLTAAAA